MKKITGKQPVSGHKVPAGNHIKRRLFMGASLRKYSSHHALLRSNIHRNSCSRHLKWGAKDISFQKRWKGWHWV